MKRTVLSQTARDLGAIRSSFLQVRILHYASATPATAAAITARLRPHSDAAHFARILARMTRSGLFKVTAPPANQPQSAWQYSLTPKGRRVLNTAKKRLRQLAAQQFTSKNQIQNNNENLDSRAHHQPLGRHRPGRHRHLKS